MTPVVSEIAVYRKTDGALLYLAPAGAKPNDPATGWVALPANFDEATMTWTPATPGYVENAAKVQAALITKVKADNETRVRGLYSTNFGKQKKYSRKQQEVMDFRALASALTPLSTALTQTVDVLLPAFGGLSVAAQRKKFRFAMAEAAKRSVSVAVIIGEYEAAIETIEAQIADWEAIELEAIRAIKAAGTAAAKRAVYAAINWNWRSA